MLIKQLKSFIIFGFSANKTGISAYIQGIKDKTHLSQTQRKEIDKASITAYWIRFKTLKNIAIEILQAAIRYAN